MDLRGTENPRIPINHPELNQSSWLIEYAASQGLGIAPGEPAVNLLYTALEEGEEKQKLAALYTISRLSDIARQLELEHSYQSTDPKIRQAASETIWRLQACGLENLQ